MELSNENNQDGLLHHVLLPRVLPQKKTYRLYDMEFNLMIKMVKNVEKLAQFLPPRTVEFFQRLYRVHMMCTKENLSREINALCPGDTFSMFVRLQHTAIMIYVPVNENANDIQNVIVSTVPVSLHPEEIYKNESDIEVILMQKQ